MVWSANVIFIKDIELRTLFRWGKVSDLRKCKLVKWAKSQHWMVDRRNGKGSIVV